MKWLTAALLVVAAILAGLLVYRNFQPKPLGGTALDNPVHLPAIPLVTDQGQPSTLAASNGRMRLIFYGFVRCPDVCPTTLTSLKNIYSGLSPEQQQQVNVQLVSVDPVFDRPKVVRQYLDLFDKAFIGLTGTSENINKAAQSMFVGIVDTRSQAATDHSAHTGGTQASGATNATAAGVSATKAAIIHGDQVSVVTPAGDFVRVYNNGDVLDGTLERDLPQLIKTYGK